MGRAGANGIVLSWRVGGGIVCGGYIRSMAQWDVVLVVMWDILFGWSIRVKAHEYIRYLVLNVKIFGLMYVCVFISHYLSLRVST